MLEKVLGLTTVLAGAWLYFVGWVYIYFFFLYFSIDIYQLDISLNYILVHAFSAIRFLWADDLGRVIVFCGLLLGLLVALIVRQTHFDLRRHRLLLGVVAGLVLFVGGFELARVAAERQARQFWDTRPVAYVALKAGDAEKVEPGPYAGLFQKANANGDIRHLLSTTTTTFLMIRDPAAGARQAWVVRVANDDIEDELFLVDHSGE